MEFGTPEQSCLAKLYVSRDPCRHKGGRVRVTALEWEFGGGVMGSLEGHSLSRVSFSLCLIQMCLREKHCSLAHWLIGSSLVIFPKSIPHTCGCFSVLCLYMRYRPDTKPDTKNPTKPPFENRGLFSAIIV